MMKISLTDVRLLTAILGVVTAGPALSGDLAVSAPQPTVSAAVLSAAPAPVAKDWTGAYGGLTFGVAVGDGHAVRSHSGGAVIELDVSNGLFPDAVAGSQTDPIGGVTLGYNTQRGTFVGGLELDLSASQQEALPAFSRIDPGPLFPGVITNTSYRTEISSLATLRLRGGYAAGRTFFYGTAGVAAGRVANEFTLNLPNFPGLPDGYTSPNWHEDETRYGFVVGAGIERRLTDRISLKGEALYYDLQNVTVAGRDPTNFPGQEIDYTFDNDGLVLRLGLNVSF